MSCFLCGHEKDGSHHLGCAVLIKRDLTEEEARAAGLLPPLVNEPDPAPSPVEIVVEGKSNSVPVEPTVGQCELEGCDNPKYSDHPRVKYCEDHKDPKNRKE